MFIFKRVADIEVWLNSQRQAGRTIGFAPTMGALHHGHLELIRMADRAGDLPVASIFVNPTQFNDLKDLDKYPRMPERDAAALARAGCAALFMPPVEEVYPPGLDLQVKLDFRQLDKVMEGVFRPGHFTGMATVVKRLLDIIGADRLYMGQKDYQQLTVVRDLLRQTHAPTDLIICPTVREPDGLAMSSRNLRLKPEMRAIAPVIYQTLVTARQEFRRDPAAQVQDNALSRLREAGLRPEYFDIVDGLSLLPVENFADSNYIVACTAAWAGEVRLIDNIIFREP